MYEEEVRREFTRQARSFGTSKAMTSRETVDTLVELVPREPDARWVDLACGPGVITRAVAQRVASVVGVDLTPAMVAEAERRTREENLANVSFELGDCTALELDDGVFDGAITRLSLHHIPVPGRVVAEMARVVRPGGWVLISDLVADRDTEATRWREEVERLRDPSHWACRPMTELREMGAEAGLEHDHEELVQVEIDFDEWLARGSGGRHASALVDRLLACQPEASKSFRVVESGGSRRLRQRYWIGRWRRRAW